MGKTRQEYRVYVIQLELEVAKEPGPMGVVYVGETSLTPEERYEKHKSGHRASRKVQRFGVGLLPDLAPKSAFLTRQNALRAEARTAEKLRRRGYTVFGGQGAPFMAKKLATTLTS